MPSPSAGDRQGIRLPLLLNGGVLVVAAGASYAEYTSNNAEALVALALAVGILVVLNGIGLLVAAIMGRGKWVVGFALSIALLLLVGVGTCGLMVNGG